MRTSKTGISSDGLFNDAPEADVVEQATPAVTDGRQDVEDTIPTIEPTTEGDLADVWDQSLTVPGYDDDDDGYGYLDEE